MESSFWKFQEKRMSVLDWITKFAEEHSFIGCGLILLVCAFLLVFLHKTFWNQWDNRNKKKKYPKWDL